MDINEMIKKLRRAADTLEELLVSNPSANVKATRSIKKKIDENLADEMSWGKTPLNMMKGVVTHKQFKKKWTSKKKHWTQTPAGKKRMSLSIKAAHAKKKAEGKSWRDK